MPSTPDRSPAANSPSSPARRAFNRITSPFGNRVRNIADFEVKPDDPHKQYAPGDIVTGSVRLRVTKPTRVTHLVVRLHGYVQVYKNPSSPGEGYRAHPTYLSTHRGSKTGEYFGNGFASLFEDEVVLCGDGRLAEGAYHFNFELEFPDRDLPSSIEFERGTICYMITATMTRPTAMSPILTCDHKVFFMERIDIAPIFPPKPRTITLEPMTRRLRPKNHARKMADSANRRSRGTESYPSDAPRPSEASSDPNSRMDVDSPISPNPSEISFGSGGSASRRGSQNQASPPTSDAAATRGSTSKGSLVYKVITTHVESQVGGCLRGDIIPIKIIINHTKQVKSFNGVIVTLYRVARVDMRPSIPLGPTEKGKDAKFEDYYPRSVTGLGGLSLSGSGSTHVFRKDLSQTIAPLYIDPQTLTAEVKTRVRVPEEVFPTISTVPGQMISFKYYIEVVLDVQGRLVGQDRNVSSPLGQTGLPTDTADADNMDVERSAFTPFGSTIVDTTAVRRDKSVVTTVFELVVGTRDSDRKKGKRKMIEAMAVPETEPQQQPPAEQEQQPVQEYWPPDQPGYDWYDSAAYYDPRWYQYQNYHYHQHEQPIPEHPPPSGTEEEYDVPPPLPPVPMPHLDDESRMSEKERIRQAEARLLPSQPPGEQFEQNGGAPSSYPPTAPYLPEENGDGPALGAWSDVRNALPASSSNVPNDILMPLNADSAIHTPNAPDYEPPAAGSSAQAVAGAADDKQEMHRQRLQAEASAPPIDDEEGDDIETTEVRDHAPSAPTLEETNDANRDTNDSHADARASISLPRYER